MISLYVPSANEYDYEARLMRDPMTMSYNAGYDLNFEGYHYVTGCIDLKEEDYLKRYNKRIKEKRFFAYVRNENENVGYVEYHYDHDAKAYHCDVVIEDKHRHRGFGKEALQCMIEEARRNHVVGLYDEFEECRKDAYKMFLNCGFKVVGYKLAKKFKTYQKVVIVKLEL